MRERKGFLRPPNLVDVGVVSSPRRQLPPARTRHRWAAGRHGEVAVDGLHEFWRVEARVREGQRRRRRHQRLSSGRRHSHCLRQHHLRLRAIVLAHTSCSLQKQGSSSSLHSRFDSGVAYSEVHTCRVRQGLRPRRARYFVFPRLVPPCCSYVAARPC